MKVYNELRTTLDLDRDEAVEVMTEMREESLAVADEFEAFNLCNYLFVPTHRLDEYLADYLSNDEYCLGCFIPWFISDRTGVDQSVIESMQDCGAFEAVGKLILSLCDMKEFASAAASADGYGHFLNSYDGQEYEVAGYTVFKE